MVVHLKSGFMRGGSIRTVTGEFPDYKVEVLIWARECTWHDDKDGSKSIVIEDGDPRPLFLQKFWGVGAHTYEYEAQPLNEAARRMCEQPLPEGWVLKVAHAFVPATRVTYRIVENPTLGDYLLDLVAGREPVLCPPDDPSAREAR